MKPYVKSTTPLIISFLSLMFSSRFSKTSIKGKISYLNRLSLLLLYKHSFKKKLFLTFPMLNNSALLKITTDILQIHHFRYQFFQNLTFNTQFKKQFRIYSLFLQKCLDPIINLFVILKSKTLVLFLFLNFFNDELLPFLATSDNRHPFIYFLHDFSVSHFNYLTYDNHSIN